jgi:dipeptidyl aminopeptidase/acylaminoacyl peptidase
MSRSTGVPTWEQRVRAPALLSFSLTGPAAGWAGDVDRGYVLSTSSGRAEVHAFDAGDPAHASLRQLTSRPQGTLGARISPDGETVVWFDDDRGSELGRWVAQDWDGGNVRTLLPGLSPAYGPGGCVALRGGRAVVGRLVDTGFELGVVEPDGAGRVVYSTHEPVQLVDVSSDESRALLVFAPDDDWLHPGSRVVDLGSGDLVAEVGQPGRRVEPLGFGPGDPEVVLVAVEPDDLSRVALWHTTDGRCDVVAAGELADTVGYWFPDGESLLLVETRDARTQLHRHELASGVTSRVGADLGTVAAASPRADGSVQVLVSRSDRPVSVVRVTAAGDETVVVAPPGAPPAAHRAHDVHAEGPGGRVHALLTLPAVGSAPYPTLFVVHGGPTGQDLDAWNDFGAAYNDLGYAVVRVNYRGSTGYGAAWREALHRRLGFIELEDVTAVRQVLEDDGVVASDRVSIVGGSWGGFLTLMALGTQPERWRSGVALVPLADWFTNVEDAPAFMSSYDRSLFGGSIEELPDAYRAASPITYADAVTAPVFITAGENDPRCPVRQVDTYVAALRGRGHDVHYDRMDTGHAMPDIDLKVGEMRGILDFLGRTNPADA